MRVFVAVLAALLLVGAAGAAGAAYPPKGTILFPGVMGAALQESLRVNFRPPVGLTYAVARDHMYAEIDNHGGQVTCVYTGFTVPVAPNLSTARTEAFNNGINTEHTWPQSKGATGRPMEADLHHLFPTEIDANAKRAAFPFDEIPDNQTDLWYINQTSTASPDPTHRDDYSEFDGAFPGTTYMGRWEPREVHEGNVARAMFYFWTVYRAEATAGDPNFFNAQKNALRQWSKVDTADTAEYVVGSSRVDLQACKLEYSIVSPK